MSEVKKINLIPQEAKNKYANKYLILTAAGLSGIMLIFALLQLADIGILSFGIKRIEDKNKKYDEEKAVIEMTKERIKEYTQYIADYETETFPFSEFMNSVENIRPQSVNIISLDTRDRLINEGNPETKTENLKDKSKEEKEEKAENTNQTAEDGKSAEENSEPEDTEGHIAYSEDIKGKELVLRGFGSRQDDISTFIYSLSQIPGVSSVKVSAIEEHTIEEGKYNIFEIIITGGDGNEAFDER